MASNSMPLPASLIDEAIEAAIADAVREYGIARDDPLLVATVARCRAQLDQTRLVFTVGPPTWTTP